MASPGWADLYGWQLDRASRTPLTRQICVQVRAAVLSGALRPGTQMPSSRILAGKLGVARASVVAAYEHLIAEGYVESRAGSGTFICGRPRRPRRAPARGAARGEARRATIVRSSPTSSARRRRARRGRSTPAAP